MILDLIEDAAKLLRDGELVAFPTETVYGLAAPIFEPTSVQKIFTMKGRPADNPLIAHISSLEMVEMIAENVPDLFYKLTKFWPGPLAIILPKKESVPAIVSGGHSSIAIRMPNHPIALQLIALMGCPLVAPSANLSGKPSPTSANHVLEDFSVAVLDGGKCQIGLESTVISLVHDKPTLLRPGAITIEQLEEALGMKVELPKANSPALSPGMKYRHYAPKATLHIVETAPEGAFILSRGGERPLSGETFYAQLREADQLGVASIYVVLDPISKGDSALMNRLYRAAGSL